MTHPVDHLLYAAPTLDQGMDEVEAVFGTRPVIGGRHPAFGTHNALLSLGSSVYLEVIARDPDLLAPPRGPLIDLPGGTHGRLVTWVLRVADIAAATRAAERAGVALGDIEHGQRETPAGDVIRWRLTDPYADRLGGALPFLIDWGKTPHPGGVVPPAGRFLSLAIEHPEPDALRAALRILDSDVEVREGDAYRLLATIDTTGGPVELR